MLQQAYLARKVSEDAFLSLDKKFSEYQKEHPRSTSYILDLSYNPDAEEMKILALHFSDAGYDVFCTTSEKFEIDWTFAEEGRTGIINIRNAWLTFTRDAKKVEK